MILNTLRDTHAKTLGAAAWHSMLIQTGAVARRRLNFGTWPTPVHDLPTLSSESGVVLAVKRDDLSGDLYGGNRVRQMEWLLADVLRRGAKRILSFGGVGSNYVVALAAYAKSVGIEVDAIVVDQPMTEQIRKNLLLAQHFGAHLHFAQDFPRAAWRWFQVHRQLKLQDGVAPYTLRPGAATAVGSLGYAYGAIELAAQIRARECPQPDRIFVAVSSCGTMAGLLAGLTHCGLDIPVTGVQVAESYVTNRLNMAWIRRGVLRLLRETEADAPAGAQPRGPSFDIDKRFFGGKYGIPTTAGAAAVAVAKAAGLELEGTYTGKAFAAMLRWSQDPQNAGKRALFWNTYNSVDLSPQLAQTDWHDLPRDMWRYFDASIPMAQAVDNG